jgi:hypothetical protein
VKKVAQDNTALLADLARQIATEHSALIASFRQVMNDRAFKIGGLLLEAKKLLKHGKWSPWVTEHCGFTTRTATFYMKIAGMDEANRKSVADLPLRAIMLAVRFGRHLTPEEQLALPRNQPKPEPTPEQRDKATKDRVVRDYVEKINYIDQTVPGVKTAVVKRLTIGSSQLQWWKQSFDAIAEEMAKHFTEKQIESLCATAVALKKAAKPSKAAHEVRASI